MDNVTLDQYTGDALNLLEKLIATPSFSREEDTTATILGQFLLDKGIEFDRIGNNIIARQQCNQDKPLLIINSHHDTVRPCQGWSGDPFTPVRTEDRLVGLGSNDAGASLVSMCLTFLHLVKKNLPFCLIFIASAEEEISGAGGIRKVLSELALNPSVAVVGEPTSDRMAVAEKGLMVVDACAKGVGGHVAHGAGENAIYKAIGDIEKIRNLKLEKESEFLGPVKLTVSQIEGGSQHNVIPDVCNFVIDCRTNEFYNNSECLEILKSICDSELNPRSLHLSSSGISIDHPLVKKGIVLGKGYYGSPTLSDQVFFQCPSMKIGPGDSRRSHRADEYILISELKNGIKTYIELLSTLEI